MAKYNKTNKTTEELVSSLKEKGLIISNNAKAINYIRNIGYFRLKAYFYPLYKEPKHKHLFKQGASFDKLMNMYRFDRMTERKYFKSEFHFNSSLSLIQSEYEKSKEEFIIHFKNKYSDSHRFPPAWMIAEILPLGNLCHIFMNLMSPKAKKKVAKWIW